MNTDTEGVCGMHGCDNARDPLCKIKLCRACAKPMDSEELSMLRYRLWAAEVVRDSAHHVADRVVAETSDRMIKIDNLRREIARTWRPSV